MGDKSKIEWTDATWNPTTGCTKVSQGCRNCYALREWARLSANPNSVYFGRQFTDVATHEERLRIPLTWKTPRRVFVDSMSDLFHAAVPDVFIVRVFETMMAADRHTFQVLTKRPERLRAFIQARDWRLPWHIQIGVSCEDQFTWDERVPDLLSTPAEVRFVSLEPLLGMIDGRGRTARGEQISVPPAEDWPIRGLSWVIVGGESGPAARPTHPVWVRWLRDQCKTVDVPFFFKQWGEWLPGANALDLIGADLLKRAPLHTFADGISTYRVGKKVAGRQLDGQTFDELPVP